MSNYIRRFFALLLCFLLCFEQSGIAAGGGTPADPIRRGVPVAAQLDIAGSLAAMHSSIFPEKFRPLHLRFLQYLPQDNSFKLLLDKGSLKPNELNGPNGLNEQAKELMKYFFIGLSLPNDAFWVNLRPDSPDEIIDPYLAQTDIGKILLEADLELKKDTARATSPETPEGREYWNKLYEKAAELYGNQNVTIPTLTRPWIVPDEIIIRESQDSVYTERGQGPSRSAYVYKATLKVMLEQDYLKSAENRGQRTDYSFNDPRLKELNEYSSQIIREKILPKLTKDINNAKRYAPLRQVYYSLILAQWFKARQKGTPFASNSKLQRVSPSAGGSVPNLIDRKDLSNLQSKTPYSVNTYFNAYKENFAKGEYNIKEPTYTPYGQVIRSYFSGGASFATETMQPAIDRGIVLVLSGANTAVLADKRNNFSGVAQGHPGSVSLSLEVGGQSERDKLSQLSTAHEPTIEEDSGRIIAGQSGLDALEKKVSLKGLKRLIDVSTNVFSITDKGNLWVGGEEFDLKIKLEVYKASAQWFRDNELKSDAVVVEVEGKQGKRRAIVVQEDLSARAEFQALLHEVTAIMGMEGIGIDTKSGRENPLVHEMASQDGVVSFWGNIKYFFSDTQVYLSNLLSSEKKERVDLRKRYTWFVQESRIERFSGRDDLNVVIMSGRGYEGFECGLRFMLEPAGEIEHDRHIQSHPEGEGNILAHYNPRSRVGTITDVSITDRTKIRRGSGLAAPFVRRAMEELYAVGAKSIVIERVSGVAEGFKVSIPMMKIARDLGFVPVMDVAEMLQQSATDKDIEVREQFDARYDKEPWPCYFVRLKNFPRGVATHTMVMDSNFVTIVLLGDNGTVLNLKDAYRNDLGYIIDKIKRNQALVGNVDYIRTGQANISLPAEESEGGLIGEDDGIVVATQAGNPAEAGAGGWEVYEENITALHSGSPRRAANAAAKFKNDVVTNNSSSNAALKALSSASASGIKAACEALKEIFLISTDDSLRWRVLSSLSGAVKSGSQPAKTAIEELEPVLKDIVYTAKNGSLLQSEAQKALEAIGRPVFVRKQMLGLTARGRLLALNQEIIRRLQRQVSNRDYRAVNKSPLIVVDFGFGEGGAPTTFELLKDLKQAFGNNIKVIGIDMNQEYVTAARKAKDEAGIGAELEFYQGTEEDFLNLGLTGANVIVAANVLGYDYYTGTEQERIRMKLCNALSTDGVLMVASAPVNPEADILLDESPGNADFSVYNKNGELEDKGELPWVSGKPAEAGEVGGGRQEGKNSIDPRWETTMTDPRQHSGKQFRYVVYSVSPDINQELMEELYGELAASLWGDPQKISKRGVVCTSLIDQGHVVTLYPGGFILSVPSDNILRVSPKDIWTAPGFYRGTAQKLYTERDSSGLISPEELLSATLQDEHNEVDIAGTGRNGDKTSVIGLFIKVDSQGYVLDRRLFMKLRDLSERYSLALISIRESPVDPGQADTGKTSSIDGSIPRQSSEQTSSPSVPQKGKPGGIDPSTGSGSMPLGDKGGIDFRFLPIVTQSMDSLKLSIRTMPQSSLQRINLTQEWSDIERLVSSGITPSAERLKDYLAASCFKGNLDSDMDKIVSCISDILRMEEETCCSTDPTLKDILVVLGSGRNGEELKEAFAGS